jgi:hypothetical protein
MASDRSRRTDRPHFGYVGVVAQQGRVILDRDFNAQQGLAADRVASDALNFVGPCGTPDDGFRIYSPAPSSPPTASDFTISPGIMYVGGQLVTLPADKDGAAIHYSYYSQPDWPAPDKPTQDPARELVYLDATEQEVSAVEDPDLLEVALGGPDTTQRIKLLRRVRRMTAPAADCAGAWEAAIAQWGTEGLLLDPATMQLLPQVTLQVGFTADSGSGDPCDPVATGGYLGADNQLIRVRIDRSGSQAQLVWGYDNASFLYRIASISADRTTLTLAADPPDAFHVPQTGQCAEVLRTGAFFAQEPDQTDPSGQRKIQQVAADSAGVLCQLAQPFGPTVAGDVTNHIVLTTQLSPDLAGEQLPLFLRIWQAALPLPLSGGTVTLADPATGVSTGVTVTVSVLGNGALPDGAFWQIAVRPGTPQGVYPEDLLAAPQLPDGPRRWACPLAVIDWTAKGGATVTDCRNGFDNLVELTRRKGGCCTVEIDPGKLKTTPLQTLINNAVAQAHAVTICFSFGDYPLQQPLRLDARHSGLTLESCAAATLLADPISEHAFADGLIVLTNANDVTLRGLTLKPPRVAVPRKLLDSLTNLTKAKLDNKAALHQPQTIFGVRALNSQRLTIRDCHVAFVKSKLDGTGDLFGAAIFLQGDCTDLSVRGCKFTSEIAPTYNPLTFRTGAIAADTEKVFSQFLKGLTETMVLAPAAALNAAAVAKPADGVAGGAPPAKARAAGRAPKRAVTPVPVPAPAPAAPLFSIAEMRDQRTVAALHTIASIRFAIDGIAQAPIVATAGILATAWGTASVAQDRNLDLPCLLGDANIQDTVFTGLTFATWFSATALSLRLQDNRVQAGVAGLWLEMPGAAAPPGTVKGTDIHYPQTTFFTEFQLLQVIASTITLPTEKSVLVVPKLPPQTEFDLIVRGNQVDTGIASGDNAHASSALLFALYQAASKDRAAALSPILVLSGNRLRCKVNQDHPAALITLAQSQPCAITGNVIQNRLDNNPDNFGPSLWLMIEWSSKSVEQLGVTGNVLLGASDLAMLRRVGLEGLAEYWTIFNADPG